MPPVITREEAHRLGEIGDRAEIRTGRLDGATPRGHGRPAREHEEAALAGAADDGRGGPRR